MFKFYRAYFALALLFGFHRHVLRLSTRWANIPEGSEKARAGWSASEMLLEDGYAECPLCTGAVASERDHLDDPGTCCHQQDVARLALVQERAAEKRAARASRSFAPVSATPPPLTPEQLKLLH